MTDNLRDSSRSFVRSASQCRSIHWSGVQSKLIPVIVVISSSNGTLDGIRFMFLLSIWNQRD